MAPRRLDSVSSGPKSRKLRNASLARMTSRRNEPSTRVASPVAAPGASTFTAYCRKSGGSGGRVGMRALAYGGGPIRLVLVGNQSTMDVRGAPAVTPGAPAGGGSAGSAAAPAVTPGAPAGGGSAGSAAAPAESKRSSGRY